MKRPYLFVIACILVLSVGILTSIYQTNFFWIIVCVLVLIAAILAAMSFIPSFRKQKTGTLITDQEKLGYLIKKIRRAKDRVYFIVDAQEICADVDEADKEESSDEIFDN